MKAEVITIVSGDLFNNVKSVNIKFLVNMLEKSGFSCFCNTAEGNDKNYLKRVINNAEKRAKLVILIVDVTAETYVMIKETLSEHLAFPLVTNFYVPNTLLKGDKYIDDCTNYDRYKSFSSLQGSYEFVDYENNYNGFSVTKNNSMYITLSSSALDHEANLQNFISSHLKNHFLKQKKVFSRTLRLFNIDRETVIARIDRDFINLDNTKVSVIETTGELEITIIGEATTKEQSRQICTNVEQKLINLFGEFIYGYDDDSLLELFLQTLRLKRQTVSAAESLTGGLFQQELTSIPGVSDIYTGGMVVYTEQTKQSILGVPQNILAKHGVVSSQCALAMAEQIKNKFSTTIGIGFTGVAGPGKLENKPVGTAYIGYSFADGESYVQEYNLGSLRTENRILLIKNAFYYLLKKFR